MSAKIFRDGAPDVPSPIGRGWREAPGEGPCTIDRSDPLTPPSPHGRGLFPANSGRPSAYRGAYKTKSGARQGILEIMNVESAVE